MECYVRKHDKLVRHLDMCIEEVSREYARVTMPITENHKNGMGVAHGGAIWYAWSEYARENWRILARCYRDGQWGEVLTVASGEAHVMVMP